jgi:phosphatidylserine/phosphatidylglycerophosphate/cardiolipin synthase-like enzyme
MKKSMILLGLSFSMGAFALPAMTIQNPLFKYTIDEQGKPVNTFEIDYNTLVDYYSYAGNGILTPTQNFTGALTDRNDNPLNVTKEELKFRVNLEKMTITPTVKAHPEAIQDMFAFDIDRFIHESGEVDFISAKYNYYKNLKFDEKTQYYDRNYLHLSDWKSLNHPPVKNVDDTKKFLKTNDDIPKNSRLLTKKFNTEMDDLSKSELTKGNKIKLLVNSTAFDEKLLQVKNAKKSIYAGVMTFASDPSSFELIDALIAKHNEGLDVQIMVEKLWTTLAFKKTRDKIINSGIKLIYSDDMYYLNKHKRGLFHNKIWLFDNEKAIVGGQNIVNSANKSTGFNHWNKEVDALIEGPMVTDVLYEFAGLKKRYDRPMKQKKVDRYNLDIGATTEELEAIVLAKKANEKQLGLRGSENYETWFSNEETRTNGLCRFINQGPHKDRFSLSKTYMKYFQEAEKQINLVSHRIDFELDNPEKPLWETKIFNELFSSADRGVDVKIITNGIDGGFAEIGQNIAAGNKKPRREKKLERKFARQLRNGKEPSTLLSRISTKLGLKSSADIRQYIDAAIKHDNVNVWLHFQFIHSKTIIVDNILTGIGSFNFENYSANSSHESSIFCFDRNLAMEYKKDNIRDMVNSTPVIRHEDRLN